jgi:hypothetical protein
MVGFTIPLGIMGSAAAKSFMVLSFQCVHIFSQTHAKIILIA